MLSSDNLLLFILPVIQNNQGIKNIQFFQISVTCAAQNK